MAPTWQTTSSKQPSLTMTLVFVLRNLGAKLIHIIKTNSLALPCCIDGQGSGEAVYRSVDYIKNRSFKPNSLFGTSSATHPWGCGAYNSLKYGSSKENDWLKPTVHDTHNASRTFIQLATTVANLNGLRLWARKSWAQKQSTLFKLFPIPEKRINSGLCITTTVNILFQGIIIIQN